MTTITSDIPREVEDVLIDIKYITGLPPGKKYDINSKTYVDATGWSSRTYRTVANSMSLSKEDRKTTFTFIKDSIASGIVVARDHPRWNHLLCEEITKMSNAMTNLRHVYHNDPRASAEIDTIKIRIGKDALRNACAAEVFPVENVAIFVNREPEEDST